VHLEWVNFERDNSVDGKRTNIVTSLDWNSENSWYFFHPNLQFAFTDYQLQDNPGGDSQNRALPTLGVDTGLIFERLAGSTGQWRQTLEPRLYFLHTPYDNQDDIPDFDTSVASQTYRNLFRNNRFNGADRIGDATQVTVGLASRLFNNASGAELLHARIGQIFYFKDRRVTLNGEPTDNETSKSDIIAEVDFRPISSTVLGTRLVYDPQKNEYVKRDLSLSYRDNGLAANLGYYYNQDDLEQALVSVAYPINERWEMVAKWNQSLQYNKPVENLLGLSYQSCCWGLKILAGQTGDYRDDFANTENSIFFEITFKGLSQAGEDIDTRLSNAIPGYRPPF
jgi:LPS-assembly protein